MFVPIWPSRLVALIPMTLQLTKTQVCQQRPFIILVLSSKTVVFFCVLFCWFLVVVYLFAFILIFWKKCLKGKFFFLSIFA